MKEHWVDNELLEKIHDKDMMLKKAKRAKKLEDWIQAQTTRNEVNRFARNKKASFIKHKFEENKGNHKRFRQTIRQISFHLI